MKFFLSSSSHLHHSINWMLFSTFNPCCLEGRSSRRYGKSWPSILKRMSSLQHVWSAVASIFFFVCLRGFKSLQKYCYEAIMCSAVIPLHKFSIKDFSNKDYQIRKKLRIWSHLLKKSLMENFIFCAVFAGCYYHLQSRSVWSRNFSGGSFSPRAFKEILALKSCYLTGLG